MSAKCNVCKTIWMEKSTVLRTGLRVSSICFWCECVCVALAQRCDKHDAMWKMKSKTNKQTNKMIITTEIVNKWQRSAQQHRFLAWQPLHLRAVDQVLSRVYCHSRIVVRLVQALTNRWMFQIVAFILQIMPLFIRNFFRLELI